MVSNTKSILSNEVIESLVRTNFGEQAAVSSIEEFSEGFFNAVYGIKFVHPVNGYKEIVLKVGIDPDKHCLTYEKDIMKAEVAIYQKLEPIGVPVPKVLCYDFSRCHVACEYFFMEKLCGATWDKLKNEISEENEEQLQYQLGKYTAMIHSLKGEYYGYIKEDKSYQFETWQEAFKSFIYNIIDDGRKDNVDLPYDEILDTFDPLWHLLDEVKEPSLVNYDMWSKNILLDKRNGTYVIDGIIDHERAFYGDPLAEFISTITICGDITKAIAFQKGYAEVTGDFFSLNRNEQIRFAMYNVYVGLIIGVEIYRYEESDIPKFLKASRNVISEGLGKIKELVDA
jgi:aminoglycoside phosphotransferase (APT) family kinase protein